MKGIIMDFYYYLGAKVTTYMAETLPNPAPSAPGGLSNGVSSIIGLMKYIGFALCVVAIIGAGLSFAIANRHQEGGETVMKLGQALAGVAIVAAAVGIVGLFM
jgi:hypothetical protein